MAGNTIGGIPATIVFTLIISFFAFFASVTCVTLYYYKRDPRRQQRLRQLEQGIHAQEPALLESWTEAPIIWEVWADEHPKPTSNWKDLLPLNLTYEQDRSAARGLPLQQSAAQPVPSGIRGTAWGPLGSRGTGDHTQPPESNDEQQSRPGIPSCNLSVFVAMPSPHGHLPPELGGEFAIGTAEVLYPLPESFHP